ncbi:ferredoxin [Halobacteriales archaeon QS_8_69_26]|nr:MAG: ferredoxin [Halobacteriales archaeon QS_8_69_26]
MESPYEVLGIDPDADESEVVDAYRERVKEAHPDHGGSESEFRAVRAAYERIKDGEYEEPSEPGGSRSDRPTGGHSGRSSGGRSGRSPDGRSGSAGRARSPSEPTGAVGQADDDDQGQSRVEYLNYDALVDHGWDLGDEDLFEKAAGADLDPDDYGRLFVGEDETLLEAAENRGFAWPFACRGGACTNCAVAVVEGDIPVPPGYILPDDLIEKGIRLSCITAPVTDEAKVVYNVKHLPGVDELRLQPNRFERTRSDD